MTTLPADERRIYKYALDSDKICEWQCFRLPRNSKIIGVDFQGDNLVFWAEVDLNEPTEESHHLYLTFTGYNAPQEGPGNEINHLVTLGRHGIVCHIYHTMGRKA